MSLPPPLYDALMLAAADVIIVTIRRAAAALIFLPLSYYAIDADIRVFFAI